MNKIGDGGGRGQQHLEQPKELLGMENLIFWEHQWNFMRMNGK